ncbi:MAG: kelch repeat-containing protein [Chloroflexota bacterium]
MSQALPAGTTRRRRRALMGLLDADGWTWASVKAFLWFILMIVLLAYIPDRAYYFTVNRTLDLGLLAWSPVNFCPPENGTLPCPAPGGSVIPWEPSPASLALPAPRTAGSVAQVGTKLLYIGGSDGSAATATTYVADAASGTFTAWTDGPALPEARADTAAVVIGSTVYLLGGAGTDGVPVDTIWTLTYDQDAKTFGQWTAVDGLALPAARAASAAIPVSDGLLVAGGFGPDGKPQATVWKSTIDSKGLLGAFSEQAALLDPVARASMAQVGDYVWVWGGTNANGPSGGVQRGDLGIPKTVETPAPDAVAVPLQLLQWAVSDAANMPARSAAAGFSANGALYVVGGNDGSGPRSELYWAIPDAKGEIDGWKHLDQMDLPAAGLEGGTAVVTGVNAFVIGGMSKDGIQSGTIRANLAPQEPFFQAGLVGVVVPALRIDGEIGQQLGYLSAAGVGTVNAVIMILIGWAYAHPGTVRSWIDRRRGRRP